MSSGPIIRKAEICNKRGLHARASAKFCALAGEFESQIRVMRDGTEVGGCSIMGLMMLGAGLGSTILIKAEGDDADAALEALAGLVADRFGEDE